MKGFKITNLAGISTILQTLLFMLALHYKQIRTGILTSKKKKHFGRIVSDTKKLNDAQEIVHGMN